MNVYHGIESKWQHFEKKKRKKKKRSFDLLTSSPLFDE